MMKTNKITTTTNRNTTQKSKQMSNMDPIYKPGVYPGATEG